MVDVHGDFETERLRLERLEWHELALELVEGGNLQGRIGDGELLARLRKAFDRRHHRPPNDPPWEFYDSNLGEIQVHEYRSNGGFGWNFLGSNQNGLDVSIKLVPTTLTSEYDAFDLERRMSQEIGPNGPWSTCFLPQLGSGHWEPDDERSYGWLAVHWVNGDRFDVWDRVGPDAPGVALDRFDRFLEVAKAIAELHAEGIVHQDLGVHNLLLQGRRPFVIDWGMARRAEHLHGGRPREYPFAERLLDAQHRDHYALAVALRDIMNGIDTGEGKLRWLEHDPWRPLDAEIQKVIDRRYSADRDPVATWLNPLNLIRMAIARNLPRAS